MSQSFFQAFVSWAAHFWFSWIIYVLELYYTLESGELMFLKRNSADWVRLLYENI